MRLFYHQRVILIYVFLGVVCEVYWAYGLKHFIGNTWGLLSVVIALVASFSFLILACRKIETSIAYAIFVGLGCAGLVGVDMIIGALHWQKLLLLCTLLIGVIGLKYTASHKET